MYQERQQNLMSGNNHCDFTATQFQAIIINRTNIENSLKSDNATNIIVTKLVTPPHVETDSLQLHVKKSVGEVSSNHLGEQLSIEAKPSDEDDDQFISLVVMKKDNEKQGGQHTDNSAQAKEGKPAHGSSVALCSMCGKNFSSNYNLKRHMNICKLCPDYEKSLRFQCHCGRTYSQEWDMKRHKVSCQDSREKCKNCLVPDCNLVFYHRSQLASHMKKDHNLSIQDPEVLEFDSINEFQAWKEREEEQTHTYYSKQTGSNVTGVSVNTYYVCQNDGSNRTHDASPRKTERRNKKGRIKTGRLCWSQMNVKQFHSGTVRVTYFPSHTHVISASDAEHHPLPSSIASEIKRRLANLKSDGEDLFNEYPELKKSKKKHTRLNMKKLRALARKNRKLFRITSEAVEDPITSKAVEVKEIPEEEPCISDKSVLFAPQESPKPNKIDIKKELLECCNTQLSELSMLLESGKISENLMKQIQETLGSLIGSCQDELMQSDGNNAAPSLCGLTEVMYHNESLTPDDFPLSEDPQPELDLKTIDKTVYQVVSFDAKEEPASPPSEELLYHNAVELVAPREFIFIASNEHAQILHPSHIGLS